MNRMEMILKKHRMIEEMEKNGYKESHTAYAYGYMSRKADPTAEPYKGIYGEGYKIHSPAYNTNRYHLVTYVIKMSPDK